MGYCSISPTCRTVSDSAPLRGRGGQAGAAAGAQERGREERWCLRGRERSPPRRGAGNGVEGVGSAVTAPGPPGLARFVAQAPVPVCVPTCSAVGVGQEKATTALGAVPHHLLVSFASRF